LISHVISSIIQPFSFIVHILVWTVVPKKAAAVAEVSKIKEKRNHTEVDMI